MNTHEHACLLHVLQYIFIGVFIYWCALCNQNLIKSNSLSRLKDKNISPNYGLTWDDKVPGHSEKCFRRKKKVSAFRSRSRQDGVAQNDLLQPIEKEMFLPNNLKARQSELSFWGRIRNT
jgi:hypothetical protein